ncbi:MAG: 6-carboxytetrahydropterin synthase [Phycisphaerae bacterium]|nr:6-carboxytetrahydropterin synthase [Phycisphaerae bacterium]
MFEITVESAFCAAHAIIIAGVREPVHGHNFRVTVTVEGDTLDGDGLLCDFHTVAAVLGEIIAPFENRNLNETDPFTRINPTAERIAAHIGDCLAERLDGSLAPHARIAAVRVTEAEGCAATYRPARPA